MSTMIILPKTDDDPRPRIARVMDWIFLVAISVGFWWIVAEWLFS